MMNTPKIRWFATALCSCIALSNGVTTFAQETWSEQHREGVVPPEYRQPMERPGIPPEELRRMEMERRGIPPEELRLMEMERMQEERRQMERAEHRRGDIGQARQVFGGTISPGPQAQVMHVEHQDPMAGTSFSLQAQGLAPVFFTECSGIGSENEYVQQKVVNKQGMQVVRLVPGQLKFLPISCKRPITGDMTLQNWRRMVEQGNVNGARRYASLKLINKAGMPGATWDINGAWPVKLRIYSEKGMVQEEIVLASERTVRK